MRKEKLKKFKAYVDNLLPHEAIYLQKNFQSQDPERIEIMEVIQKSVNAPDRYTEFDDDIDKRKYSSILNWMKKSLDKINVDQRLKWISGTHQSILLDQLTPELEAEIVKMTRSCTPQDYYFLRYYEMLVDFRHYLLIRMRYTVHQKIHDFMQRHEYEYQRSKLVYDQMHHATADIIGSESQMKKEAIQWKKWLNETFRDTTLDGRNRYMALIRYIFICLRYNLINDQEKALLFMDQYFQDGKNHSRRILVNYYDNMLVMYDKKGDFEKAKYYGYLSIKHPHPDALIYRNNLANVLIKRQAFQEALTVIEEADFKIKSTRNFHSVVGFVSNHIRCLTKVGQIKEAEVKGRVFLQAYRKNILKYRWHRFFAAYHGALIYAENFEEIIRNTEKYHLHTMEEENYTQNEYRQKILNLYYLAALRSLSKITVMSYRKTLNQLLPPKEQSMYDKEMIEVVEELK